MLDFVASERTRRPWKATAFRWLSFASTEVETSKWSGMLKASDLIDLSCATHRCETVQVQCHVCMCMCVLKMVAWVLWPKWVCKEYSRNLICGQLQLISVLCTPPGYSYPINCSKPSCTILWLQGELVWGCGICVLAIIILLL